CSLGSSGAAPVFVFFLAEDGIRYRNVTGVQTCALPIFENTNQYAGYPLKIPVVDIVEIGNGGGSIAWIDESGSIKVGPKSAGARSEERRVGKASRSG